MEKEKNNYNLVIGIAALILIILAIAIIGYFVSKPKPLVIQGEAEASEYRVSGKVPGRIEEFYVKEGQQVHKGDTIAFIDSPEVRAKLIQANAARNAATAQSNKQTQVMNSLNLRILLKSFLRSATPSSWASSPRS